MTPQGSTRSTDPARRHPQGHADRIQHQLGTGARRGGQPRPKRILNLLGWLMLPCLIAMIMQACGWMSLFGVKALVVEDTRARIQADYSPWPFVSFLPVDSAILEEISEQTGRSINVNPQDSSGPSLWGNLTPVLKETATAEPTSTLLWSETPTTELTPPTATMEVTPGVTPTSTSAATSTATIPPTASSTPTILPSPTDDDPGNKYFNYTSTPEQLQPTDSGKSGSGSGN